MIGAQRAFSSIQLGDVEQSHPSAEEENNKNPEESPGNLKKSISKQKNS